ELRLVEREGKTIGAHHVGDDRRDRARLAIDAIDIARADLADRLVALIVAVDAVHRIGEPDRAIRPDDGIVGRVELFAVELVGEGGDGAVMLGAADPAAAMLAGDEATLTVDGIAVAVA